MPGQKEEYPPGVLISSMMPGGVQNADSWTGALLPALAQVLSTGGNGPAIIEPNWVLYPNTTLQFQATIATNWQLILDNPDDWEPEQVELANSLQLAIGVHVWEFPGMDGMKAGEQ